MATRSKNSKSASESVTAPPKKRVATKTATATESGRSRTLPVQARGVGHSSPVGARLRARRESLGISLRQFARDLNVSASFISQLETGKAQPSVATLYSICEALRIPIDDLFSADTHFAAAMNGNGNGNGNGNHAKSTNAAKSTRARVKTVPASESPVVTKSDRHALVLDSGVTWERLTSTTHDHSDFMFVRYDVGGSSTRDGELIRHSGTEYGYIIRGELEVTLGFDTFRLGAGDSISFDSTRPHRLVNVGEVPVEAVWFDQGA